MNIFARASKDLCHDCQISSYIMYLCTLHGIWYRSSFQSTVSIYLSIYLSIYRSMYRSIYLSIYLSFSSDANHNPFHVFFSLFPSCTSHLTFGLTSRPRQALDSPAISTDDHLKFQGLDASAGAQLMEAGVEFFLQNLWFHVRWGEVWRSPMISNDDFLIY